MDISISKFRTPSTQVDRLFLERWSPRAFTSEQLTQQQIDTLFEAARWAPSSFNRQPWIFIYETIGGKDRAKFEAVMMKNNRDWACRAPLLTLVLVEKNEGEDGADPHVSPTAAFDAGSAWMSLALQARTMGIYTHAMGGIDRDVAHDKLRIPRDKYYVNCMVAVGMLGNPGSLPDVLREREYPSDRKSSSNMVRRGGF